MSEFDFIEKIKRRVKVNKERVLTGIGDDCALIKGGNRMLITVDSQVENIHFRTKWGNPETFGRKLVRINISDIYAKGGIPEYALLSLGADYKSQKRYFENYINGVLFELEFNNVQLIGGNISSVRSGLFFDLVVLGSVTRKRYRGRDGAKEGDLIAVSGKLGDASSGLEILERGRVRENYYNELVRAFMLPEVIYFGNTNIWKYITSSIDISDGLSGDLTHILKESHCGAEIYPEEIPVSSELAIYCRNNKQDILKYVLSGGEDYRLLVTLKRNTPDDLIEKSGFKVIGRIVHKKGLFIKGIRDRDIYKSFEHF
ncbi:MAG: thiamine-phosphate kinase [Deltaproteobacteria bacterium]|nr:thiamine-phosphate kinase [Deltaproteobacteria bacterium]